MAVVTARVPDEELALLKEKKLNISAIVQDAIHRHYSAQIMLENSKKLAAMGLVATRPSEDIIRELRDEESR